MTQLASNDNSYANRVGVRGDVNRGNRGLFSEQQTEERLKVHARAIAMGNRPTIPEIVQLWKDKFGIEISTQSEREWRQSNRDKILKAKQQMISSGEIEVPIITGKEVADNMATILITTSSLITEMRRDMKSLMHAIRNEDTDDPYKAIGVTEEEYFTEQERWKKDAYQARLKRKKEDRKEKIHLFEILNEAVSNHIDSATKQLKILHEVSMTLESNEDTKNQLSPRGAAPKTPADLPVIDTTDIPDGEITDDVRKAYGLD